QVGELAGEGAQGLRRDAADGEDLAVLALLLVALALALALLVGHLRDLGHEVAHVLDLLLRFLFAGSVDGVGHFLAGGVHRVELESRHGPHQESEVRDQRSGTGSQGSGVRRGTTKPGWNTDKSCSPLTPDCRLPSSVNW